VSLDGNEIRSNVGDGFRVVNNGNSGAFDYTVTFNNNIVEFNTDRGINILNQGTADTTLVMNNNFVNLNANEGVYVMNTASTNQSADFGAAVLADGAFDAIPRLNLTMDNNVITGNGNAGTSLGGQDSTGGFILRVGTSDAPIGDDDNGGFASDGRGGVVAFVTNNDFVGNAGNDVFIHSFVSAVLGPTGTTWDAATYTIGAYRGDPLARLDLAFTGNTGDEALVTNQGAFYNNAEATFKSRTAGPPAGPFTSATRRRNAQRLASRAAPYDAPIGAPDFGDFLYPGVGGSTFRRTAASSTAGFTTVDGFLDVEDFLNPIVGEEPFVWGIWP
jgi:hypothetical protein